MVASIQLIFPFPVKLCLNITRELKKLNVFRHIDTMFMARHIVSVASTSTSNFEQCNGVGAWTKHGICQQPKALRKASRK